MNFNSRFDPYDIQLHYYTDIIVRKTVFIDEHHYELLNDGDHSPRMTYTVFGQRHDGDIEPLILCDDEASAIYASKAFNYLRQHEQAAIQTSRQIIQRLTSA